MTGALDPDVLTGPLDRATASALLARGDELLDAGDAAGSTRYFRRVIGHPDVDVTAAALLGLGQALSRLGLTDQAVGTWEDVTRLPATGATYLAWREIGATYVRTDQPDRALAAYRKAEPLAPPEDRQELASRIGWLSKETGDRRGAERWFRISRGGWQAMPATWTLIGVTVATSAIAYMTYGTSTDLYELLQLDKPAVAAGEVWRLWTVTLVHAPLTSSLGILHLLFNMYALYVVGPVVERIYGARMLFLFYLLFAAAGSVASFVFSANQLSVGASGAIFGLIGLVFVAGRVHHWAFDQRTRAFAGSLGVMVLINVVIGFSSPVIDNAAHLGGLAAGAVAGFLVVPRVASIGPLSGRAPASPRPAWLAPIGMIGLVAVIVGGLIVGRMIWLA